VRKKAILLLSGVNDGKTLFSMVVKNENHKFFESDGWWTWAINPSNVLGVCARTLGSPGIRDNQYFEFIGKLKTLANEYWDFENNYIEEMVQKFLGNDKTEVLVIHGANDDQAKKLQEDHGAFSVMITSKNSNKNFVGLYDKVLVWDNDTFVNDTKELLEVLTKEEEKGE
jgi:hypothetical protein